MITLNLPAGDEFSFDNERDARKFLGGYFAALRAFAHWRDGVQYLGTGSVTLLDQMDSIMAHFETQLAHHNEESSRSKHRDDLPMPRPHST